MASTNATASGPSWLFLFSSVLVAYVISDSFFWHFQNASYQRQINQLSSIEIAPNPSVPEDTENNETENDDDDDDDEASRNEGTEGRSQGNEDDLSLATLETLSQHPNYDIRQAARTVLFYRFANSKECCARLRSDLRNADKQDEATAVMRSLVTKVDLGTLLGPSFLTLPDPTDMQNILDGFLNAGIVTSSLRPVGGRDRMLDQHGPMVTLEEVEGENGGIVSVRVPSLNRGMDSLDGMEDGDDLELRRWQRREAMVIQLDAVEEYLDEVEDELENEADEEDDVLDGIDEMYELSDLD